MEETKTNTVTTPSGVAVVLKQSLSAGDFLDASDSANGAELSKLQLSKRIMDLLVVSVNGVSTDVPTALRALPLSDYLFLSAEVKKLIDVDFTEAKTQTA